MNRAMTKRTRSKSKDRCFPRFYSALPCFVPCEEAISQCPGPSPCPMRFVFVFRPVLFSLISCRNPANTGFELASSSSVLTTPC